jgi:selenocysteine-specific translation elongation factor
MKSDIESLRAKNAQLANNNTGATVRNRLLREESDRRKSAYDSAIAESVKLREERSQWLAEKDRLEAKVKELEAHRSRPALEKESSPDTTQDKLKDTNTTLSAKNLELVMEKDNLTTINNSLRGLPTSSSKWKSTTLPQKSKH